MFAGLINSTAPARVGPPDRLKMPTSTTAPMSSNGMLDSGGGGTQPDEGPDDPGSSNAATSISIPYWTFASAKYPSGRRALSWDDR